MASSKRAKLSLDWYVISARSLRVVAGLILLTVLAGAGGFWFYRHFNRGAGREGQVTHQGARFIQITGQVKVKRSNMPDFIPAREDMALAAGDTIQTPAGAVARVQFVDGSSYTIKPETTLVIKDNALMSDKTTHVQVNVRVGTINLATNEQSTGSSNVVQTSAASARIGGNTEASVATGVNGSQTDIRVTRGKAQISSRTGENFAARDNEHFEFEASGKLARRLAMIPSPGLQSPANLSTIRLGSPGSVLFNWAAVSQARSYRIEIATSASFGETVVASRDGLGAAVASFDNLSPGTYYWRVKASDEREMSAYSEPFKFTLVAGVRRRELGISQVVGTALGGQSYLVEGHSDPGARVKVSGVAARTEANGDFRAFVTLGGKGREVLIEAEDRDGNTGQKRVRF